MAACTNGTCQRSYCEQPVSKVDIPVNWVVEFKLPAPVSKIDYLCINYIVDDLGGLKMGLASLLGKMNLQRFVCGSSVIPAICIKIIGNYENILGLFIIFLYTIKFEVTFFN